MYFMGWGQGLEWSWAAVLERKFGVEQEMQVNTFL